jgi:hypothetical protein
MKTIWKFTLALTDSQRIEMPEETEILTVQLQGETIQLWAVVDLHEPAKTEMRTFEIHGTGNPISDGMREYIGTFQQPPFVWHVFERVSVARK